MSEEAQRIAIATAVVRGFATQEDAEQFGNPGHGAKFVPDYLHDLNAMHEAEETFNERERIDWFWNICAVLNVAQTHAEAFRIGHATAAQRAEAFLRVKRLWK